MGIAADLRYASRQLLKNPIFAVVSLLSLALGIGATTAVFSVIYGVLLHPFPYRGADRMVSLRVTDKAGYNGFTNYLLLSARQFQDIQKADVLDGAIATDNWDMSATGQDVPEAIHTGKLSANAFQYFGVSTVLGRAFVPADGLFGEEPQHVTVLSYGFWQSHFGGSPAAIGKTFQLDREDYTIVGIAPPNFTWFHSDVYIPLRLTNDPDRVSIIDARLKPGVTPAAAQARLEPLIEEFAKESPKHFPRGVRLQVNRLNAGTEKRFQGTLMALFSAVTLLLVVGCANVSILLLGRARARRYEFAVRSAIGASRARIIRQLLTEALLLATLGCALGVALADRGVPLLLSWFPENSFSNAAAIHINGPVLLFSLAAAFSTGILFGIWPALRSVQPRATPELTQGRRLHTALIAGQVALTVLLLAGAGASIQTFLRLYQSPMGFDPSHVLAISLQFPDGTHTQIEERQNFYAAVHRKIAALPGVESAAIYPFGLPPQAHFGRQLEIFDQQDVKGRSVYTNSVSREFFEVLRIPILQGRTWSEQETKRAAHVAIVNQSFARRYWPNTNALGRKLRLPDFTAFTTWMLAHPGSNDWLEVVGIVGDTPNDGLRRPVSPAVYVPYTLVLGDSFNLAIRARGNPLAIAQAVRKAVKAVNPGQPVNEIRTAEEILSAEGWSTEKFIAMLFLLFASLALALAAIGLYSVVSFAVTQRNKEFGIRMALGAPRASILKLVLSSGIRAVMFGLLTGLFLCALSNNALRHWTQSSMYDPVVILPVSLLLFLVMISASVRPAWRASTIDPARALRNEISS